MLFLLIVNNLTVLLKARFFPFSTFQMVAPMALFYLNRSETLMPLAIQLNQQPGPNNPVSLTCENQMLLSP